MTFMSEMDAIDAILKILREDQEKLNCAIENDFKNRPLNNPKYKYLAVIKGQEQFVKEIQSKCAFEKDTIITNITNNLNRIVIIYNINIDVELMYNEEVQSKLSVLIEQQHYYKFSKKQYLENKTFIYNLRQELGKDFPQAWINIFPGREENTYCINFMLKRN